MEPSRRTAIYVDGFNLYYRALKGTAFKWLDLNVLCRDALRPSNDITRIRYFTAMVSGKRDPAMPQRQQTYLRALRTIPHLSIHTGRFLVMQKWAALHEPPPYLFRPTPATVSIVKTEEKGSDVSLATWLVRDGFKDEFDVAVVLSNDTDLVEPIRMVVEEVGKPVGLLCPTKAPARSLAKVATFCRFLTTGRLAAAQFPDRIDGTTIRRPETW
jgi:hypothetical protein